MVFKNLHTLPPQLTIEFPTPFSLHYTADNTYFVQGAYILRDILNSSEYNYATALMMTLEIQCLLRNLVNIAELLVYLCPTSRPPTSSLLVYTRPWGPRTLIFLLEQKLAF